MHFLTNEQIKAEKEQREKYESLLEDVLTEEKSNEVLEMEDSKTQPRKGLLRRIKEYFGYRNDKNNNPFDPKFNPREEFVVWVKEEFPELWNGQDKSYENLERRRKEVYKAAKKACKHGIKTTDYCVRSYFYKYLRYLDNLSDKSTPEFVKVINSLVEHIEFFSVNLNTGKLHYGTRIVSRR